MVSGPSTHPSTHSSTQPSGSPQAAAENPWEVELAEALTALRAGDSQRAEAIYERLLAAGCSDCRLFSNLGAIALQRDQAEQAVRWLEQGLALEPGHARCLINYGMALHQLERGEEAIEAFRRSLASDPTVPEAWHNLSVALREWQPAEPSDSGAASGDGSSEQDQIQAAREEAIAASRQALALNPAYAAAAGNLARLLADQGDPVAGERILRSLPEAQGGGIERFDLAEMLRLQGRIEEALGLYEEASALAPQNEELRLGVAVALLTCGQADQALMQLLPLMAERPENPRQLFIAGLALQEMGDGAQAISFYERALALDPQLFRVRTQLGVCFFEKGEFNLAIEQFRAGLAIAPRNAELHCNLAAALRGQGDLEGSIRGLDHWLEQHPTCQSSYQIQLFSYSIGSEALAPRMLETARRYWELVRRQPERTRLVSPGQDPGPLDLSTPGSAPLPRPPLASAPVRSDDQRLRIGFISAEIGNHVVGAFLSSFLEHVDRNRFAVELFAVSRRFEARAEWMAARVDQLTLLTGMGAAQARSLIRERRLDILVETSGFTRSSGIHLLAERLAPVQCHYIGYHASTGLDTIDWFIGDTETVPESFAPQFVEGLWRLPRPWLAAQADPNLPPARSEAADGRPVLGSCNQLAKVREETLEHWLAALKALPTAQLLIKDRGVADPVNRQRIIDSLGRGGVEPERITFLPLDDTWLKHMAVYNRIDVALDATPWSSATTGFDALVMGVPLVAIRGGCTSARMSSAILRGLGRPEWIADSPERFGAIVAGLCADLATLRQGKAALRQDVLASPLFDGADLSRALEQAFLAMVAANKKGPETGA
jgi:protein O-GlcNAc transferase